MQSYQALLEQMSGQKRQTIDRLLKRSSNSTSSPGCIQLRCMGSGHQGKRKLTATMLRYDVRFKQSWCHWHRKGNSKKKRKCSLTCQAIQWAWVFFAEVKEHLCFLPISQYNWVRLSCLMLRALKICDINRTEAFHLFPEAETYHTISGFHLDWCFYTVLKTVQREVWELSRLNCGPNLKYFFRSTFFHMCIKSLNTLTEINQSKCSGRYHRFLLSPLNRLIWPIWNHLNRLPACRLKYMPTCVRSARTCILHVTRVFRRLSPDILLKLLECKRRLFAWMGVQQRSARNAAL